MVESLFGDLFGDISFGDLFGDIFLIESLFGDLFDGTLFCNVSLRSLWTTSKLPKLNLVTQIWWSSPTHSFWSAYEAVSETKQQNVCLKFNGNVPQPL